VILETPGLAERLLEALRPELMAGGRRLRDRHGQDRQHYYSGRAIAMEGRRIR